MPFAAGLHYLEAGSGDPPLVLLHAFPLSAEMWQPQLDGLADRCRVIAPDLDFAPSGQQLQPSMDDVATRVAKLIGYLELPPVVLGGVSMGGYVAFALLRNHRQLVRAVVLADTRPGADTDEVRERRTNQQSQVAAEGTQPLVEAMLGSLPGAHTRETKPDVMEEIRRLMAITTPEKATAALEAMKGRPDSTADLAGIDLPALVVVGEQDTVSPPDVAEEMHARLPDARLAVIPDAGHLANVEAPEAFNAALRAFLDEIAP